MRVYHVMAEREDGWYVARAMEDANVFTQARTLEEIIVNIREVADLMYGEKQVQIELVVPPPTKTRLVHSSLKPKLPKKRVSGTATGARITS